MSADVLAPTIRWKLLGAYAVLGAYVLALTVAAVAGVYLPTSKPGVSKSYVASQIHATVDTSTKAAITAAEAGLVNSAGSASPPIVIDHFKDATVKVTGDTAVVTLQAHLTENGQAQWAGFKITEAKSVYQIDSIAAA